MENSNSQINENLSYLQIFKNNLFNLHPVLLISKNSNLLPFNLNIFIFSFNILIIFGFNAIFYSENIIEKRITNNNRNKIYYPISNEIIKILLSILFTIVCNFIIKLIILITLEQNNQFKNNIKINGEENRKKAIKEFNKNIFIRRLISKIVMGIIIIFFFYYCTAFCGIYRKTQLNWLIGGIWSLLFEWIILTPLYILLISLIEKLKVENVSYYMKNLFIF